MVRLEKRPRPSSESGSNSCQIQRVPALATAVAVLLPMQAAAQAQASMLLQQSLMALESLLPVTAIAKARLVTGKRKEEGWKRRAVEVCM